MAVVQSSGQLLAVTAPWYPTTSAYGARSSVALYQGQFSDYASIWRTQPAVRTVIGFIARNIAQLGLHVFDRVDDRDRRRIVDGATGGWLRTPAPGTNLTMYDLINGFVSDLCLYDNAYLLKVGIDDRLATLPLTPPSVEPRGGNWMRPDTYRVRGDAGYRDFDADQVIHVHGYNPSDRRAGVSPMETLRQILAEDLAASRNREQMWDNGARIGGWIERPKEAPKWGDDARRRFKGDWTSRYTATGPEVGGTPILEEGMTFHESAWSPKDAEYVAARKLSREEVAAQFWVYPSAIGIMEHANFSNITEQHKATYQDTLGPTLQLIEQAFGLQLSGDLDLPTTSYFEFNLKEKLRGSFEEESKSLQTATGAPYMTRNEARATQNLPPVGGGDEIVTPLNVLIGGQASPTDSGSQNVRALSRGVKAQDPGVVEQEAVHRQILERFFRRQSAAVTSRIGSAGDDATVAGVFDIDRWNDELTVDLVAAALSAAQASGDAVVDLFGGTWDVTEVDGLYAALEESASGMAAAINAWTVEHLAEALDDDDAAAAAADQFADQASNRAPIYATSRANTVWNFARGVAATSVGVTHKRWRTTSSNPRAEHRKLNGETVAIGKTFSNGMQWPGDPTAGGAEDRANCRCTFDLLTEETT